MAKLDEQLPQLLQHWRGRYTAEQLWFHPSQPSREPRKEAACWQWPLCNEFANLSLAVCQTEVHVAKQVKYYPGPPYPPACWGVCIPASYWRPKSPLHLWRTFPGGIMVGTSAGATNTAVTLFLPIAVPAKLFQCTKVTWGTSQT